jgi:hypothetical protein
LVALGRQNVIFLPIGQRQSCDFFMPLPVWVMDTSMIMCPACGECFEVAGPCLAEIPAEWDYDCEICCRPMVIVFDEAGAHARGLAE